MKTKCKTLKLDKVVIKSFKQGYGGNTTPKTVFDDTCWPMTTGARKKHM